MNTRPNDGACEGKLGGERLVLFAVFGVLHPLAMKIVYFAHYEISFARFNANSISRPGVFSVFFINVLTTTTRFPTAVT